MKYFILLLSLLFIVGNTVLGQKPSLELSRIMAGNEFIGIQPDHIQWSPDSKSFYFKWNRDTSGIDTYYQYTLKSQKLEKLSPETTLSLPVNGFISNQSRSIFYFKKNGKLFKWSSSGSKLIYASNSPYRINHVFENGDLRIEAGNNFYLFKVTEPSFTQITNFVSESKSEEKELNYLEKQQLDLFEIEKKRKQQLENQKTSNLLYERTPKNTIYLDNKHLEWVEFNKTHTRLIYSSGTYPENEPTEFANFVNSSGKTIMKKARSKVGQVDPTHSLQVYDSSLDETIAVSISELSGVFSPPEFRRKFYSDTLSILAEPKNVIYHNHGFNDNNEYVLIEIKSYDNKDRWITLLSSSNELIEIDHQHNDAWIGGPGISGWNMVSGNCGWIDNSTIYYQSEKTGYSHLYTYDLDKKNTNQLTNGKFEIHEAELSQDKTKFYLTCNKRHPGNREFYSLSLNNQELTPILTEDGNHEVVISPNEKNIALRYSSKNKPWEIYTSTISTNSELKQITESQTDEFKAYPWRSPEVITFKASDNQLVYARIYEPEADVKNGAAILFVHGAGYLQNAHNWWSGYYREYMFNNLLCDKGFTILDIDYRASKGYGSSFRTDIYRHMGGKDLSDHMDGRQLLIDKYAIDPERIGIYGGSYGGFITLMGLLTEPGKFKCGAAIRSVTDWAHYNHEYTSNILNTPAEDPEAFKISSPIYYADSLRDKLLMLHGMEDDNVQYQDVVRLSQRFIEFGKTNWDLIGYPIEPHGFVETTSWIDEYGRILKLFEDELSIQKK